MDRILLIYWTHYFGWWAMLVFLATVKKVTITLRHVVLSLPISSLIYAIPTTGFQYFLERLIHH